MPIIVEPDAYYNAWELKELLGKSIITIRRYLAARVFPGAVKRGNTWYVSSAGLIEFLTRPTPYKKTTQGRKKKKEKQE